MSVRQSHSVDGLENISILHSLRQQPLLKILESLKGTQKKLSGTKGLENFLKFLNSIPKWSGHRQNQQITVHCPAFQGKS